MVLIISAHQSSIKYVVPQSIRDILDKSVQVTGFRRMSKVRQSHQKPNSVTDSNDKDISNKIVPSKSSNKKSWVKQMEADVKPVVDEKPKGWSDERWSTFVKWKKAMTEAPEAITSKPFLMKHMKFCFSYLSSVESSSIADVVNHPVGKVKTMQVDYLEDKTPLETNVAKVMKPFKWRV